MTQPQVTDIIFCTARKLAGLSELFLGPLEEERTIEKFSAFGFNGIGTMLEGLADDLFKIWEEVG